MINSYNFIFTYVIPWVLIVTHAYFKSARNSPSAFYLRNPSTNRWGICHRFIKIINSGGNQKKNRIQKPTSYSYSINLRFLKRNLPHVGMVQCMNALVDKVQKQEVPYTQWYELHNMATLFNNHPYISSRGTSVGTKFTATYNRDDCWIMWACYGVHITVCPALHVFVLCQPVHSCIGPSLHG